jgi:glutamate-ammonia-ligase adenylyltransferase
MADELWDGILSAAPAPERARQAWQKTVAAARESVASMSCEDARIMAALWSGSEWATEWLVKHPEWIEGLRAERLASPRPAAALRREVEAWFAARWGAQDYAGALAQLRQFRQREMIRIAARDLARLGKTEEIIGEISAVADVCLGVVFRIVQQQLLARFGSPFEQDTDGVWRPTQFCVLGMGKLGGQELNYSSDVDVLFVYSDEGSVFRSQPRKGKAARPALTNHQFFTRLAESFIAEVGRLTAEGMLFRIDARLRPEGEAGPLVRSLGSYENYYAQWGQTWERMMLIKARCVAGAASLAGEFLEMVQPFRFPRSTGPNVLGEIAAVKQRIEAEASRAGELENNVKLGPGGIREIEFVAQSLQLLHGGRNPFLQSAHTLPVLQKLAQYHLLEEKEVADLASAYTFLRDVEHRLQMDQNRQTHSLPVGSQARERVGRLMGFDSFGRFEKARQAHTKRVRSIYDRLLKEAAPESGSGLPRRFDQREAEWETILASHSFREPARATKLLREFALGPGYGHVSVRTTDLAMQLIPRLLAFCPGRPERNAPAPDEQRRLSDPDRVVARLDAFVSAYGARATLYEMWSSNIPLFELMLFLFDRSEFLAEVAIRTPDLVDELVLSGHLQRRKTAPMIMAELRHGARDADQRLWLRRYHQSELMRIGLRDILGLADYEQNFEELSALADACLAYALEAVMRRHRLASPPLAIFGWGKLGGHELNYGSDLDVTFVAPDTVKSISRLQPLAAELMELLSSPTELGAAFVVDARLRPDGEKGLLVNTVRACEEYYRRRAMLWEIQSLTRTRFIAGHERAGEQFQAMARTVTDFSRPPAIAAYTPEWKAEIARMRERIEKERTPAGRNALAIKTGTGGLIDAEFIAQALCLEHGWQNANTLAALRHAESEGWLKTGAAQKLIDSFRKLRRVEAILRRWSYAGETVLPDDAAPLYRVAVRCGFEDADAFLRAIGLWRADLREAFHAVFGIRAEPKPAVRRKPPR